MAWHWVGTCEVPELLNHFGDLVVRKYTPKEVRGARNSPGHALRARPMERRRTFGILVIFCPRPQLESAT